MRNTFYPSELVSSAYNIDFEKLYEEGYRGVIFDIDNTLVLHGAPADARAEALFKRLRNIGFDCCLLSNNRKARVDMFNRNIRVHEIWLANKPFLRGYREAMNTMGTDTGNTVYVGDQIFTDVWGASRLGMYSILVRPINPKEEIQIVLKRFFEKPVLNAYRRSGYYSNRHEISAEALQK